MASKNRTVPLDKVGARLRLKEARAYLATAELLHQGTAAENKVAASNAILAGIAAADATCGLVLGERCAGDDHAEAVTLLKRATAPSPKAANSLKRLLMHKTPIQYGADPVTAGDVDDVIRWARDVVDEAVARDL